MWMSQVTMRPQVAFSGDKRPTDADIADLHHRAHDQCFIANSVTTKVIVE
jgi:organic hydroperoxide reductase OsmC/OhrA